MLTQHAVYYYSVYTLRPAEQDVGRRNIFENKWGTKARILVMVGGGHAALVQRCLIYVPSVRSESPKTRGQEFGGLGRDGGEADQRFPYLILLQFLDVNTLLGGFQNSRFPHFLFATLCVWRCILVFLCAGCWQVADSIGNVILIHQHCTE